MPDHVTIEDLRAQIEPLTTMVLDLQKSCYLHHQREQESIAAQCDQPITVEAFITLFDRKLGSLNKTFKSFKNSYHRDGQSGLYETLTREGVCSTTRTSPTPQRTRSSNTTTQIENMENSSAAHLTAVLPERREQPARTSNTPALGANLHKAPGSKVPYEDAKRLSSSLAGMEQQSGKKQKKDVVPILREHLVSRKAMEDFMRLVETMQGYGEVESLCISGEPKMQAFQADRLSRKFGGRSRLDRFLCRLMQASLLVAIDADTKRLRRERISGELMKEIIRYRGRRDDKTARRMIHNELAKIRTTRDICSGSFEGLLCFLPLENENHSLMGSEDIKDLHSCLDDYVKSLCKLGSAFQTCILEGRAVSRQEWQTYQPRELETLSHKDLFLILCKQPDIIRWADKTPPVDIEVSVVKALETFLTTTEGSLGIVAHRWRSAIQLSKGLHVAWKGWEIRYGHEMAPRTCLASECWDVRPTMQEMLVEFLHDFDQDRHFISNREGEPQVPPIHELVTQLDNPRQEKPLYGQGFKSEKIQMKVPTFLSSITADHLVVTSNICTTYSEFDMHDDHGEHAILTVDPGCAKVVAIAPDIEENRAIMAMDNSENLFSAIVGAKVEVIVILLTSETAFYMPPGLLHATYTICGGITSILGFVSPESLEPAAYACDTQPAADFKAHSVRVLLTAVKLRRDSDKEEWKRNAAESLCKRYKKLVTIGRDASVEDSKLWEFTKNPCAHCGKRWKVHKNDDIEALDAIVVGG